MNQKMYKNTHSELVGKEGTIAYILNNDKTEIESMIANSTVSLNDVKSFIIKEITSSKNKTPKSEATMRCINNIMKQPSKNSLLKLVWDTVLSGDCLSVARTKKYGDS